MHGSEQEDGTHDPANNDLISSYSSIAEPYQRHKQQPWKDLVQVVSSLQQDSHLNCDQLVSNDTVILDIGGGNGRNLPLFDPKHIRTRVLLDISRDLLDGCVVTAERTRGDLSLLPIRQKSVRITTAVASLHHVLTETGIVESLKGIARISTVGSLMLGSVWIRPKGTPHEGIYEHPWKDTHGNIVAVRNYFILPPDRWKEMLSKTGFRVVVAEKSGGKGEDNLFWLVVRMKTT